MLELGTENCFIQLLFEYPECQSKDQLRKKEGEYIKELNPTLNLEIAGRTRQQWNDEHPDLVKTSKEKNYRANAGKKIECPNCGVVICQQSITKHQVSKKCVDKCFSKVLKKIYSFYYTIWVVE